MNFPETNTKNPMKRRTFIRQSLAAGLSFPTIVPAAVLPGKGRTTPNDRIRIGVIGTGNQGHNDIRSMLPDERVEIAAVCDVNRESDGYWNGRVGGREPARQLIESYYAEKRATEKHEGCLTFVDFQEMLARPDLDAVMIATPDHWHALQVIAACEAGKDIYCQKPLSLTIAEGRAMVTAVEKHHRILQCGSQQRSDARFRKACELVINGHIGELRTVEVGLPGGHKDFSGKGDRKAPEPIPEGFDYERWLGPAPEAPYSPARCHVNFRWNLDYSGGMLTDWGGHHPDIAQWGMGTDRTGPIRIRNAKGTFPPRTDLWNTATAFSFECDYANGVTLKVADTFEMGVTFHGTQGSIFVTRGRHRSTPASIWDAPLASDAVRLPQSDHHFRNFIDCILSRKEPVAPVEVAHRSITIAHLGNIAMQVGKELAWDPATERFHGDGSDEANQRLQRPMRAPWRLPA